MVREDDRRISEATVRTPHGKSAREKEAAAASGGRRHALRPIAGAEPQPAVAQRPAAAAVDGVASSGSGGARGVATQVGGRRQHRGAYAVLACQPLL